MTARLAALTLMASLLAPPAAAQALRRERPTAFPPSLTLMAGLGFGGQRANQVDPETCTTSNCISHSVGSAPHGGVEFQIPLGGTFGLGVAATIARPTRKFCVLGGACQSPDRITQGHGAALLLWRFKARAPIYFGLGPGVTYSKPGPVTGQEGAITEFGGVVVLAYDVQVASRVGLRVAWWNWLMKPEGEGLGTNYELSSLAWDKLIAVGARISLSP
jgi:hypothetical protein